MPVTITIEAPTAAEARAEMQKLLSSGDTVTSVWRVSPSVPVESVIAPQPADEPAAAAPEAPAPAKTRGRPPKAAAPAAAVETAAAAPAPEAAAQDFLDETPEPAKTKPVTRDDVRNAMMDYSQKYGMPAAQADGPKILGFPKLSAIPDTADFASLVAAMKRATETNPYDRTVVPVEAAAA